MDTPGGKNVEVLLDTEKEKKTILENWTFYSTKTKKSIWYIGGIFLVIDLLALSKANVLNSTNLVFVMIIPLLYAGLGFLAKTRPLIAMILAAVLFIAIHALSFFSYGASSLSNGFLLKAIMVYFVVSGFSAARKAEAARDQLTSI